MSETKRQNEDEFAKLGNTLSRFGYSFVNANEVRRERDDEAEARRKYDDLLVGNFKRSLGNVDREIRSDGITRNLHVRIETLVHGDKKNRLAADIFYLNHLSPKSREYAEAKDRVFDALDDIYANKPDEADSFAQGLTMALQRNPNAQAIFTCAASSRELENIKAEKMESVKGMLDNFLKKAGKDSGLIKTLQSEMEMEKLIREDCRGEVEDMAQDLSLLCSGAHASQLRNTTMAKILKTIDDRYRADANLGHIFSECVIEKLSENAPTEQQGAAIKDVTARAFDWEKFEADMCRGI